jgi:UDP:flavonoid glycosyltransferase YjiC (YdhE family)
VLQAASEPSGRLVWAVERLRECRTMRILIGSCAGTGHLLPLLPLARAARLRGHVGLVIEPEALTPEAVRDATERILRDLSFRARASAIAAEIVAMPGPSAAVEWIEALMSERERSSF